MFSPLLLDLLAPAQMGRIRSGLALNAAVPIDVTVSASLGRHPDLAGASRVGAGLSRPVLAVLASEVEIATFKEGHHQTFHVIVAQAPEALVGPAVLAFDEEIRNFVAQQENLTVQFSRHNRSSTKGTEVR